MSRPRSAPRAVHGWTVVVLRALVLLLAFEVSGFASVAALAWDHDDHSDCCSDCPEEHDGRECPPLCPSCHCVHGGVALPPAASRAPVHAFDPAARVDADPVASRAPPAPSLGGVYRPPRLATVSA